MELYIFIIKSFASIIPFSPASNCFLVIFFPFESTMFIVGKTFLEGLLTLVPSGILNNNSATLLNCSLGVPPKPLILASSNFSGLDLKSSNTSIISFCLSTYFPFLNTTTASSGFILIKL